MLINALLVEDNSGDRRLIQESLKASGAHRFRLEWADRLATGLEKLRAHKPDTIILDLSLPDSQGLDTFRRVYAQAPDVPIVIITGLKDEELAVQAVRDGAQDYLVKIEATGGTLVRALLYGIERQRAEAARAHLAAIVESSEDAIVSATPEGIILSWNAAAERMFGYTVTEAVGQSLAILIPPDRQQELMVWGNGARQGANPGRLETVRVHKDGRRIDVSLSFSPLRDARGGVVGTSRIFHDITERKRAEEILRQSHQQLERRVKERTIELHAVNEQLKAELKERQQAEEALRNSEQRFRVLSETMPQIVWSADATGAMDYLSPQALQYAGVSLEDAGSWSWTSFVHPADLGHTEAVWRRALATGEGDRVEHRLRRADGQYRWHLTSAAPLRNEMGVVIRWIGTSTDIHEQKATEEALEWRVAERTTELAHSKALLEKVTSNAPVILFATDAQGVFTVHTGNAIPASGRKPGELVGRHYQDFQPKQAEAVEHIRRALAGESFTALLEGPPGTIFETRYNPIQDAKGIITGMIGVSVDITERKRAEEALRKSEDRYRSLTLATTQVVWTTRSNGDVVGDLPTWREFTGQSYPEIQGSGWLASLHPEDRERTAEVWANAVKTAALYETEYRVRRHDGEYRYMAVRGVPVRETDGSIREWVGTCTDITERQRAEGAVRQAAAEIRDLYDNAPCGYHSLSEDGLFLRINETELRWLGYRREEVIGKLNFADVVTPTSRQAFAENFPLFLKTGIVQDLELEMVRKDGSAFPVLLSATAVQDDEGNFVMSRSTMYDITLRKHAQEAMLAERQRLFDVLETLPAIVCLLTQDYYVAFANRSFRTRFGEPEGRRCFECCFGRSAPCEFCQSYEVLKTGKPHHWELTTEDGSVFDVHAFPFTDTDGSPMVLEMEFDITQHKRAEESLRQLSARLLRAQDDERRRIARELHDSMGQELTALSLNLAWLKRSVGRLESKTQQVFSDSFELIKQCSQEIRDFSYLLYPPTLDVNGLASALRWYTDGFARRTGIEVTLDVPEILPRQSRDVETALFRVVQECLTNAHRHSGSRTVDIRVAQEADSLRLVVADQGCGMPVPDSRNVVARLGIGISGMQERMRELGGTLEIESSSSGTTIRARLPMEEERAA